uniref:Uncharacterized protein n=1 Tax=Arundo donax TaxID=35708 RepID=A0A0A9E013_ARUDO
MIHQTSLLLPTDRSNFSSTSLPLKRLQPTQFFDHSLAI